MEFDKPLSECIAKSIPKKVQKLEILGDVAVIRSAGYGCGWSTSVKKEYRETLAMDKRIVDALIIHGADEAIAIANELLPYASIHPDYVNLKIEWVPKGAQFEITEYNGLESVHVIGSREYMTA